MPPPGQKGENTYIDNLISGDDLSWRDFLFECDPIIQGVCKKAGLSSDDIDDIAQDFVLKLLGRNCHILRKYDAGKGSLFAWVKVILTRLVIDRARRSGRRQDREEISVRDQAIGQNSGGTVASEIDLKIVMEKLSGDLSPEDRMLYQMYVNDVDNDEIARLLGISKPSTQKRLSRLRERLKKIAAVYGLVPE